MPSPWGRTPELLQLCVALCQQLVTMRIGSHQVSPHLCLHTSRSQKAENAKPPEGGSWIQTNRVGSIRIWWWGRENK